MNEGDTFLRKFYQISCYSYFNLLVVLTNPLNLPPIVRNYRFEVEWLLIFFDQFNLCYQLLLSLVTNVHFAFLNYQLLLSRTKKKISIFYKFLIYHSCLCLKFINYHVEIPISIGGVHNFSPIKLSNNFELLTTIFHYYFFQVTNFFIELPLFLALLINPFK